MHRLTRVFGLALLAALLLSPATALAQTVDAPEKADKRGARAGSETQSDEAAPQIDSGVPQETTPGSATGIAARWRFGDDDEDASVLLSGYEQSNGFTARLPTGWRVLDDAIWRADIAVSPAAGPDSALRLDLAGRPVTTWSRGTDPRVEIRVPAELFDREGRATMHARTTTSLRDEEQCRDKDHIARWFDVLEPRLDARIAPVDIDVARAVAGMGRVSTLTGEPITIAAPLTAEDPGVLDTVGAVAAAIARHGLPSGWQLTDTPPAAGSGAVIVIEEGPGPASVHVEVIDDRPRLTLRGAMADVADLAQAMADPDRLLFFHADSVVADQVPPAPFRSPTEVFVFAEHGYDDRTVRGSGAQSIVYRVHIPAGVPPDEATLAVRATYAPALGDVGATLAAQINGSADEILSVLDDSGQLSVLHTVTPADLRPGRNYVKLEAQMGNGPDDLCGAPSGSNWITVSNNSAIGVERPAELSPPELGIEDARFALASVVDFVATDVAIPDRWNSNDLSSAVELIAQLSSRAQGGAPRLVRDADADTSRHLVVVGRAGERELLGAVPHVADGQVAGLAAAVPSPFSSGRVLLAFTGGSDAAVSAAVEISMSAEVNDITAPYAWVGRDSVQPVEIGTTDLRSDAPTELAYRSESLPGPEQADYDEWILDQAAEIERDQQGERSQRRAIALALGLGAAIIAGLWWVRRSRTAEASAAGH